MAECNFKPYEGSDKYLFISYAHKDSDEVFEIMNGLMQRGYRQWYDAGIEPGSEWPENIANHLKNCDVCLCFLSQNYINSQNCKREITFALSKGKSLLVIFLEELDLPAGLEMQLSSQQCVFYHKYNDKNAFFSKATAGTLLDGSLMPGYEKTNASSPEEADTQYINSAVNVMTEGSNVNTENKKNSPKPKKKVFSKAFIPVLGGVIGVLAIVALCIISSVSPIKLSSGDKVKRNIQSLTIYKNDVTTQDIQKINKLKELNSLNFEGCKFIDQSATNLVKNKYVSSLNLKECKGIEDYSFLNKMSNLDTLTLINNGLTDSIFDISQSETISTLTISEPQFTNLAHINVNNMYSLNIENSGVSDISLLSSDLLFLCELNISGTKVANIDNIMDFQNLSTLRADNLEISNPTKELVSVSISTLSMANCGLTDLSFLQRTTSLNTVDISGNNIKDITPLLNSSDCLAVFNVSSNPLSDESFEKMKQLSKINTLDVSNIPIKNLDFVIYMSSLYKITASNCCLEDVSMLSRCPVLSNVNVSYNNIEDVSAVFTSSPYISPTYDLSNNMISDITYLNKDEISKLNLSGNMITKNSLPAVLPKTGFFYITYFEGVENIRFSEDTTGALIYVLDTPGDKQETVKTSLSKYGNVYFKQ